MIIGQATECRAIATLQGFQPFVQRVCKGREAIAREQCSRLARMVVAFQQEEGAGDQPAARG